jgi:DNA-binding NtrC family response regulator
MKKILVIAKDEVIRETLRLALKGMKFEGIAVDHADALSAFLTEEPAAVVVCDYNEKLKESKGVETYKDIKNSASDELVLRVGFPKLDYADYLQMPFDLKELKKKLTKKGGK